MDTYRRIGLIGCAGLGKSMIADAVSRRLGVPFLRSKDITRPILEECGYEYSEECPVEMFLGSPQTEARIVERRISEESLLAGGFVTDRTTLECFAYALLNSQKYTVEDLGILEDECRNSIQRYTHLFYFPKSSGWLEYNGVRTMSDCLQRHIDCLIRGILDEWAVPHINLPGEATSTELKVEFIAGRCG